MQLLNRVLIEIENKINEQMLVYKAMAKISTDKTVASDILSMLVNLRFEYDFRLINNAVDIQNLYSTIVKFNPDERNDCIRFLLDLADDVFLIASNTDDGSDGYSLLIEQLTTLLTLHSRVDKRLTCYGDDIVETMSSANWKDLLVNNPWLVAAIMVRYTRKIAITASLLEEGIANETPSVN